VERVSGLKMPKRGGAAALLSELNAEHAPAPAAMAQEPEPDQLQELTQRAFSETNVTTLQESNDVSNEVSNVKTNEGNFVRSNAPAYVSGNDRGNEPPKKRSSVANPRDERLARALAMTAEDEVGVVTVRVSNRLNEYMDRYVERINRLNPKRKYRKQDAVAEAFAAFFADHPLPPAPADEEL
jgi:hypothetical protein